MVVARVEEEVVVVAAAAPAPPPHPAAAADLAAQTGTPRALGSCQQAVSVAHLLSRGLPHPAAHARQRLRHPS
jgi:hypothetical protein